MNKVKAEKDSDLDISVNLKHMREPSCSLTSNLHAEEFKLKATIRI